MKHKINIRKTGKYYVASVNGIPDCKSQGDTEEEALENIKEVLFSYLEASEVLCKRLEYRNVAGKHHS